MVMRNGRLADNIGRIVTRKLIVAALVVLGIVVVTGLLLSRLVDSASLARALERQASDALGQPVSIGELEWAGVLRPRVVLRDVRVGDPVGLTVARVEVTAGLRGLLSRRVEEAALVVSGSRLQMPVPFRLGGTAPTSPTATPADAPAADGSALTVVSVDRILLENIVLAVGTTQVRLDADSSLEGDRLLVRRLRLASERTTIEGSGEVTSLTARQGTFALEATTLDLDELMALAAGLSQPAATETTATQPPIDLRVTVAAPTGRLAGIAFANLATTLHVTPREVALEPLSVGVFGGTVTGRLTADTVTTRLRLAGKVDGLDAAAVASYAGAPDVITGRVGGTVDVAASGTSAETLVSGATGSGAVTVSNGTLPGLDLVRPVIVALGGRAEAAAPTSGSRSFSSIRGTFALAGGQLRTSDLTLTSPDLDCAVRGNLRVAGAVADLSADVRLSEALSAQAGRDLYKYTREGNRIVVPATIRGGLASPSVSVDVKALAGRAVRGAVEDEVRKGLGRLFRRR